MFTKKIHICLLISIFFAAVSCGDDDTIIPIIPDQESIDPDPTEEVSLDPTTVSDNLIIPNGSKVNESPPAPKGNLPFSMNYTTQSAFLKNGFTITFDTPANYAGAYIQIISEDGTPAPNYWDVSPYANKNATTDLSKKRNKTFSKKENIAPEQTIEVNFGDAIPPGKFCYLICVYDGESISQPQQVCVEVEAWSGNPNLVGTWNYTKQVRNDTTFLPGEKSDCFDNFFYCTNDTQYTYDNCYLIDALKLTINNDGTYVYRKDTGEDRIDYYASVESCNVIFDGVNRSYTISNGNWAYNEEEGKLILVKFESTEFENNQEYYEVFENGTLDLDDEIEVNESNFILSTLDDEDDSPTLDIIQLYFEKE